MRENLASVDVELTDEAIARLDGIAGLVHGDRNIVTDARWISSGRE